MNPRSLLTFALLVVIPFAAVWSFAEMRWAVADPPSLLDGGPGPGPAAPEGITPTQPSILVPVPDAESDLAAFVKVVTDAARTSIPAASLFVAFGVVTVARRRFPPAREGTTGILTASLLAFLTVVVGSLAMGVPVGQALGSGAVALLTGKAMSMQPQAVKS